MDGSSYPGYPAGEQNGKNGHSRRRIARPKSLPAAERWGALVRTLQDLRNERASDGCLLRRREPIRVSQLSRANRQIPASLWKEQLIAAVCQVRSAKILVEYDFVTALVQAPIADRRGLA